MIKIGLYSEDRTLHPLLSSALGKEFQLLLETDQDGMNTLVATGGCDVMILDLNSNHDSLQERIGFTRSLIAENVPSVVMADDGLRSTAFELVRTGAFGYCRRPPSIRDLKTMLNRAYENFAAEAAASDRAGAARGARQLRSLDWIEPADAARLRACSPRHQSQCRRARHRRKWNRKRTDRPRHSQSRLPFQPALCGCLLRRNP